MVVSKHAEKRCKARSIPHRVIELIYRYGAQSRRHDAYVYVIDRHGLEQMLAYEDKAEIRALGRKLRAYLVVGDDGVLITAAYPRRRASGGLHADLPKLH